MGAECGGAAAALNEVPSSVILSEAKDLKIHDFRILRSFAVFAAQDDMYATSVFLKQSPCRRTPKTVT